MEYRYELLDVGDRRSESIMVMRLDSDNYPEYYDYKGQRWIGDFEYLGRFLCGDRDCWPITEDEARKIIEGNGGTFEG